jgi:hypothetical protein
VSLVAAGFVALAGSAANAQVNIYESTGGLSDGITAGGIVDGPNGMNVNPNGIGQFLIGPLYDVRPVAGDAQINNIQIINTNTNNSNLPTCDDEDRARGIAGGGECYDPDGGILAKIRFRESKTSKEVLDFVVALSCGEVWAARVELNTTTGLPQIVSQFPVVTSAVGGKVTTQPAFDPNNNGAAQGFAPTGLPTGITAADVQRGHFEVIAMESLKCEPDDANGTPGAGELSLDGGQWTRDGGTPSNAIGGEVFLVRAASGVSHNYNLTALANFAIFGAGSVAPSNIFGANEPDFSDCLNDSYLGGMDAVDCVAQANLALSKSRLVAQYDVDPITGGKTFVVVTFPNKYENCAASNGTWSGATSANGPFSCESSEEIVCTIYDRLENYVEEEEGFISPSPAPGTCTLDREVNIIELALTTANADSRADKTFQTNVLPAGQSGWLDLDLARNPAGTVIHGQSGLEEVANILSVSFGGFHGLPTVGLVMQEFFNGNVGGTYGNTVAPLYEQAILLPGES